MRRPALAIALCVTIIAGCGGQTNAQKAAASEVPKGSLFVKLKIVRHGSQVLALVPVTIDGKGPFAFALDTGASESLVDSAIGKLLKAPRTGRTTKIAGVASVSRVVSIRVKSWRVGDVRLPPTTIVEANLPFGGKDGGVQGLLGSDMLSQFDIVTIDYDHGRLVLHHRAVQKSSG